VSFSSTVMADNFIKQVTHTEAFEMMGQKQPEKFDTTSIWLGDGKACTQSGNMSVIWLGSDKSMYFVDHTSKKYTVMPMDLFGSGDGSDESGESEKIEAQQIMQSMMGSIEVKVTPTEETKKIGEWDAKKYDVETSMAMMKSKQEIWSTEDIDVDQTVFKAVSSGMLAQMPGFDKIMKEMEKVEGVTVMSVNTVSIMGQDMVSTTKVLEYSKKEPPKGIYDISDEYKKTDSPIGAN